MSDHTGQPFESIESAREFMALLAASITEATTEVGQDRDQAVSEHNERRVEALDLALYKLKCLDANVHKTQRLLNDLRTLRRLLFSERSTAIGAAAE